MRSIPLVIFILTIYAGLPLCLDAQASRQIWVNAGLGLGAERDYGYSPLPYQGVGWLVGLAYSSEKAHKSDLLALSFSQRALSNAFDNTMQATMGSIQTFAFYHRARDPERGLHWGWSNQNEFNTRFHDAFSNFNYRTDFFTSFGPAARQRWPFQLGKADFRFELLAHAQLIGFTILSSEVSSYPRGFEGGQYTGLRAVWESLDWFHPGNSWSAGVWPALQLQLNSGTVLGLNYRYDFMRLDGAHRAERSRGQWFVSLIARL
jgi:hypothetical protein